MLALLLASAAGGCSGQKAGPARPAIETLDEALLPSRLAAELGKLGGAHVHATATFQVDSARSPSADGSKAASPGTVTTTTDLWLDQKGNYRLLEVNDQDGGREVVRVGGEIAVALRYGKMIRRAALDAESKRYLAEAVGAPWAAWELVRRQVEVQAAGPGNFRLRLASRKVALPAGFAPAEGLRKWRDTALVKVLEGQASLHPGGQAVQGFACKAAYQAERDGLALEGSVAVTLAVDQLGRVADIALPASETLQTRQRTILEEKALLGGIGAMGKKSSP